MLLVVVIELEIRRGQARNAFAVVADHVHRNFDDCGRRGLTDRMTRVLFIRSARIMESDEHSEAHGKTNPWSPRHCN